MADMERRNAERARGDDFLAACSRGWLATVKSLHRAGVPLCYTNTGLCVACARGHLRVARWLLPYIHTQQLATELARAEAQERVAVAQLLRKALNERAAQESRGSCCAVS